MMDCFQYKVNNHYHVHDVQKITDQAIYYISVEKVNNYPTKAATCRVVQICWLLFMCTV